MKNILIAFALTISIAFSAFGQSKSKKIDNDQASQPIKKIETIFNDYIKYSESTDSEENKRIMTESLKTLKRVTRPSDFEVLINIWMYYDPTDFPSRDLVFKVLKQNREESLTAVYTRIKNKKDCEEIEEAPYSELHYLYKKLEEK